MGFITGPLMLILGIATYMNHRFPPLSIVMIVMGTVRIGLTIYSYLMNKKDNQA
jgi:disulfide bond formation protein DsbB